MTISHLQIAVFLNSHPGSAFGRPVVMAGLRPAMTTGGLEYIENTNDKPEMSAHNGKKSILYVEYYYKDIFNLYMYYTFFY